MTTNRGIGLLLAIFALGCSSTSSTKKTPSQDARAAVPDGATADATVPADRPAETTAPLPTDATSKSDAAAPDATPGLDGAPAPDAPQIVDASASLDQPSALDASGQRPDAAGNADGRSVIDATATPDAALDASFTLPDVGFTLPDVSFTLPDLSNLLPDLANLLPDLGAAGTRCATLAACCPKLGLALQATCNAAVSTDTDSTCASLLATLTLAGYCP